MVTYLLGHSGRAKKLQTLRRKRSNNWPMVSFIHNRREKTTWIGYSFKIKSTKSEAKQIFLRKEHLFLNLKQQTIRLAQGHWICTSTYYNSYFCSCTYEKSIFSSSFYQRVFFLSFCWQKSCGFNAKVLLACWRFKPGFYFFFLYKIKITKQHTITF